MTNKNEPQFDSIHRWLDGAGVTNDPIRWAVGVLILGWAILTLVLS